MFGKHFPTLLLVVFLAFTSTQQVFAQIAGTITDGETSEPLSGVQVLNLTQKAGTFTDGLGHFELSNANSSDEIEISMIGYVKLKVAAGDLGKEIVLDQSVVSLNQIVISTDRDGRERESVPVAITSLQPAILNDAKATSLEQVLNKVPGVFMSDLGNEQHMMSIRQPISTKSIFLFLEDGIPIRTSGVFNHNALLEMNMTAVRSIEVIRGPYSSFYGPEAIGGAINFITASPSVLPTARVSLQGNNLGYRRGDLTLSNTFGKVGTYVSGYFANRRNGYREHSDFDKIAFTAKVNYNISNRTTLKNSLSVIDFKSDMTGSLDSIGFFGQEYSSLHTFTNRDVSTMRFRSNLSQLWNENSKTDFNLILRKNSIKQNPSYRVRNDASFSNPNGDVNLAHGEVNDNAFKSIAGIVQHKQSFDWLGASITGGLSADMSPNTYKSNYISIFRNDAGMYESFTESDSVLTDYEVGLTNLAGYLQGEVSPIDRLRIMAAVRYDHFIYDYKNNLDETAFSGAPDSRNTFSAFTPKVGLTLKLRDGLGIYANYSRGFVPPQVSELYRGVSVPNLDAALFDNMEVGGWIGFWDNKASLDLAGYILNGQNEIISVRLDNGELENQNAGQTQHIGIEYGLNLNPIKELTVRISGSNAEHKYIDYVESGNDYSDNLMTAAPGFIANSEVTYKPGFLKGFRIGVEWQHVGNYHMDPANTKEYPGFDIFNLRAGYSWKGLEAWFHVLNIGNELYATRATSSRWGDSYSPGDPRTFNIGLGYKFRGKTKN